MHDLILEQAASLQARTVAVRRDLHSHPEVAFDEHRTMRVVAERLRELGISARTSVGRTGVVAVFDTGKPGPTILARADMDALPIPDEKTVPYRSTVAGKSHACGHDGHVAILLTVAEIIKANGAGLSGRVIFVFQPAEEIVGGAKAMLEDGGLDDMTVDHVVGLHLSSTDPLGTVVVRDGPVMAATDSFRILVKGRGGHAAYPHTCIDPIVATTQLILALQILISRETDPIDQAVISITSCHGGTAHNIISEEVELKGTLRTFNAGTRSSLRTRTLEVVDATAELHRCSATTEWNEGAPAVVNDSTAVRRFRRVATRVLGKENIVVRAPSMGGDDMSLWLEKAPGCYFFVGTNSGPNTSFAHHHPRFDIDEHGLEIGVGLLASYVADLMGIGSPTHE